MSIRQDRFADEIRDLVARCFTGGQMSDPRLEGVTITAVKISSDLQIATVYYRMIGKDAAAAEKALHALKRAEGFFRKKIAEHLDIRRVPNLRFFHDESVEHGSRIEDLLSQLD